MEMMKMSLDNKSLRKRLEKYSKADIISAVCGLFQADYIVNEILITLESLEAERAIEKEKKSFDESSKSDDNYYKWMERMIQTYGDGEKVEIGKLPDHEIKRGAELIEDMNKKRDAAMRTMNRTNEKLGIKRKGRKA